MNNTASSTSLSTTITTEGDEYGTFSYSFTVNGIQHDCQDFPNQEEAIKGAQFHIKCLYNNWPHEVANGLGAIYRG